MQILRRISAFGNQLRNANSLAATWSSYFGMGPTLHSTVKLSSGHEMPIFGLGTWQSAPGEVGPAVESALLNGYKHIDCAFAYLNQAEIGGVLHKLFNSGQVKREDIFITSKVWNTCHEYTRAKKNIGDTLSQLQLDYIDLMLIHWPMAFKAGDEPFPVDANGVSITENEDYIGTWRAMEDAVKEGKVKSIGLSNFNHTQILRVIENSIIKPAVIQVEAHPYLQQKKLREFCQQHDIAFTSYSPLGNPGSGVLRTSNTPNILADSVIVEIAKNHGKSPAQVALRWAVQNNIILIPKSVKESRLKENASIFDFELSSDEMSELSALDRNFRLVLLPDLKNAPHYPFNEEF